MDLNAIARDISAWRISKGFFTPDARRLDQPCSIDLTKGDAALGSLMLGVIELSRQAEAVRHDESATVPAGVLPEKAAVLGKLMLVVTELAEAAEAVLKGDLENFREEIADAEIRLFDIDVASGSDTEHEIEKKMVVNRDRPVKHGKKTNL